MKALHQKKISWSDWIDLSENFMLIFIVSVMMVTLSFLATSLS